MRRPTRPAVSAIAFAALVATGCLLTGACAPPSPAAGTDPQAPTRQIITAEEIAAAQAGTVWDALRRTLRSVRYTTDRSGRPAAIMARGRSSIRTQDGLLVYLDGALLADLSVLVQLPAASVERIEVLSGIEASTYFGTNAGDGVIHIITKAR